ncbi:AF1514 family protein [Thiovibrio frasassiensis]|uniref:AF1514 family protein n=1 Tax=Thiovibrio frasassiensis TaxID=2984131 RepID=A0A9X4MH50_9BACT|nr:AF1514 family protein [Thiovibrio frasassiensis]MDG4476261.1 AF1514 family protein [Thiovibrio frasassiensis]
MKDILIAITGMDLDFATARNMAKIIAQQENGETDCLAWLDARRNSHSPGSAQCEIKGRPGWEVYGESHGGRVKISFNLGEYVFIQS